MKRKIRIKAITSVVLFSFIFLFLAASCLRSKEPPPDIVLWTSFGDQELEIVKQIADKFGKKKNKKILVVKVPFNELDIKFQIASPAGQGPDLIIGPHDWVGAFVTAELLSPITESEVSQDQKSKFNQMGIECMTYDSKLYGIPIFLETIAIIYNKKLVQKKPETMEELLETATAFNDPGKDQYGFFYEITNFYYSWPFFSAFGTKIFGETDGKIDVNKILVNSPETIDALNFISKLKNQDKLIPDGATTDMMQSKFFDQRLQFCLNGPWMLGDLKKRGIDFEIIPIPPMKDGRIPKPFVGVQGMMLNAQSKNRGLAIEFMMYLNNPDNQRELSLASGRIPSCKETLVLLKDQENIVKFARAAEVGTPMPTHPAARQVWGPMSEALQLTIIDGKNPEEVMKFQVQRIKKDIKFMME
ncbi:MAG: maltose ABC transporter substrate-binding protein [Candidatus Eremiobacteraeota bacterium]|nr:maltose ABC transporter substrate-binding protein [Candidatus Eremiobacteraeota bacterium]